jgi:hydroxymethylpyrimidine pyrophosphatase-like HAD family hydrolase
MENIKEFSEYINKQKCIISDLDGTISILNGRSPFKYKESINDLPNYEVINLLNKYKKQKYIIIILSGRGLSAIKETEKWLKQYKVPYDKLYLKPDNDNRSSVFYKEEILVKDILPIYNVELSLDDYDKNLNMFKKYNLNVKKIITE